jgi:ABC-2 type transport system ATP-binding protein
VTIIRAGRTVETGTLAEARHLTRISVEAELAQLAALNGLPACTASVTGTTVRCQVDLDALDEVTGTHQAGIRALTAHRLEELFLRYYTPGVPPPEGAPEPSGPSGPASPPALRPLRRLRPADPRFAGPRGSPA